MMKNFALLLGIVCSIGSCGSFAAGHFLNVAGDGFEPAQTLTATLLGFKRDAACEYNDEYSRDFWGLIRPGWDCEMFASHLKSVWAPYRLDFDVDEQLPIGAFIARRMPFPLELLICLLLIAFGMSNPERQAEPRRQNPTKSPAG